MFEAHFGVPLAGAVLNALNTRLSPGELAFIVDHAASRLLIADHDLVDLAREVARRVAGLRLIVAGGTDDDYGAMIGAAATTSFRLDDELALLALNYTSGTTGHPKGVMYSHRGAYLQALAMVAELGLSPRTVFLWTLPMFHCNGWCFPWAVTAAGGVQVGLRNVNEQAVWRAIREDGVTHLNAAPTVLIDLAYGSGSDAGPAPRRVRVATGGAPPAPQLLARLEELGFEVTHLYGLTETYGPAAICEWLPEWDDLPLEQRVKLKARQGVGNILSQQMRVVDGGGVDVPADGTSTGEVVFRGNNVMMGYFRDPDATNAANIDGWFRSGDSAVIHRDGYIELRDRLKDVIVSGGENISSIEVEQALATHAAVLECAVVGAADERWGEVPVAFVVPRGGATVTEAELIEHVRGRIAHFKAPKRIIFGPIPKTATGKIQKFALRQRLLASNDSDIDRAD
ncbi:MAG: AMP-dependent synthetase and ligase [Acidimicrobiales bacterium]|jgi:fatty-acyl-CoA synthase|nr:AMP-dependent synthetase and ligase [Acidimicrobiales bacterium]